MTEAAPHPAPGGHPCCANCYWNRLGNRTEPGRHELLKPRTCCWCGHETVVGIRLPDGPPDGCWQEVGQLLERSSLGSPGAKALRRRGRRVSSRPGGQEN